MVDANDWRLSAQMNYLFAKKLLHVVFVPASESWDHEHCEFCSILIDDPSKLFYRTEDTYHWLCEECFNDFKDMFGFVKSALTTSRTCSNGKSWTNERHVLPI